MATTLVKTDFNFPGQTAEYHGKVRDVYTINDDIMVMVATDRISAFDVILPEGIPYKGQVLNQIAAYFLDASADIVPNWKLAVPDPMVTVGLKAESFPVEMIIRGYLTGSAWREYKKGCRELCGVKLPDGMRENERFPEPIITPTTKAAEGHDENISREEIIAQGLVSEENYKVMEDYTRKLFALGSKMAAEKGLILVDTKYEFGLRDGKVILIDEIHTPTLPAISMPTAIRNASRRVRNSVSSARSSFASGLLTITSWDRRDRQFRDDLEFINSVSDRYIELYEHVTGNKFVKAEGADLAARIEDHVTDCILNLKK